MLEDSLVFAKSSSRRDKIGDVIFNGVRTARMRLLHHIPCSLHIVGEPIFVYYDSQLRTCRRCGDVDHLSQNCRAPRCYNCDKPGHGNDHCQEKPLCRACFSEDHDVRDCPLILYSGNVEPPAPGETTKSYAAAAVPSGPRLPVADQEQMRAQERRVQAERAKKRAEDSVKQNSSHQRQEERRHDDRRRIRAEVRDRRRGDDRDDNCDDRDDRDDCDDRDDRDRRFRNRVRDSSRERPREEDRDRGWSRSCDRRRDRPRHRRYRGYSSESEYE